jgi:hypothetical protein
MKDQTEVCSLARGEASPIRPITGQLSLSPSSSTRISIGPSYKELSLGREKYGLSMFRLRTLMG